MSLTAFDAGMRIRAAETGPIPRRSHSWLSPRSQTIVVAAAAKGSYVSSVHPKPTTAEGIARTIISHLAKTDDARPWRLVADHDRTLDAVIDAGLALKDGAGRFSWWSEQRELPTGWCLSATKVAADHFITGDPTAENSVRYWAEQLTGTSSTPIGNIYAVISAVLDTAKRQSGNDRRPSVVSDIDNYAAGTWSAAADRRNPTSVDPSRESILYTTADKMHQSFDSALLAQDRRARSRQVWSGRILRGVVVAETPVDVDAKGKRRKTTRQTTIHVRTPNRYQAGTTLKSSAFTETKIAKKDTQYRKEGDKITTRSSLRIDRVVPAADGGVLITLTHTNRQDRKIGDFVELGPEPRAWNTEVYTLGQVKTRLSGYTWLRDAGSDAPTIRRTLPLYIAAAAAAPATN